MFLGASYLIFRTAAELRNNMTPAELVLWDYLKHKPYGYKFRRQHPLGVYIVDFYCHSLNLIIEIDGEIHLKAENKKNDLIRQKNLEDEGLIFLRFTNEDINSRLSEVIIEIEQFIINKNG